MLKRQSWSQYVIKHSLQARAVGRLVDGLSHEGRESRAVQRPGFQEFRGLGLQAVAGHQRFQNGVPQLAEQGGLFSEAEGEEAAVREVDAVAHQNVKMDV